MKLMSLWLSVVAVFLMSCASLDSQSNGNNIDPKTFQSKIPAENTLLVDVRTPQEFNQGHIQGAINIDFYSDAFKQEINKLDHSKTILIYCASGGRSGRGMNFMRSHGFKKVYNLSGGIGAWKSAGLPVTQD